MRISDWSSDVCSSDLEAPVSAAAIIDDLGAITGLAPSLSPGEATPLRGFGIASGGSVRSVLETLATVDPLTILDDGTATAVSLRRIPDAIDLSRQDMRSEERRVRKECVSTCRSRWSPEH